MNGGSVRLSNRNSGRFDVDKFEESLSDIVPKELLPRITEKVGEEEPVRSSGETSGVSSNRRKEVES